MPLSGPPWRASVAGLISLNPASNALVTPLGRHGTAFFSLDSHFKRPFHPHLPCVKIGFALMNARQSVLGTVPKFTRHFGFPVHGSTFPGKDRIFRTNPDRSTN